MDTPQNIPIKNLGFNKTKDDFEKQTVHFGDRLLINFYHVEHNIERQTYTFYFDPRLVEEEFMKLLINYDATPDVVQDGLSHPNNPRYYILKEYPEEYVCDLESDQNHTAYKVYCNYFGMKTSMINKMEKEKRITDQRVNEIDTLTTSLSKIRETLKKIIDDKTSILRAAAQSTQEIYTGQKNGGNDEPNT